MPDRPEELGAGGTPKRGFEGNRRESGVVDARFDRWLSCRLHDAYDSVLKEELPADLACLVALLGAQSDEAPEGSDPTAATKPASSPKPASNGFEVLRGPGSGYLCAPPADE